VNAGDDDDSLATALRAHRVKVYSDAPGCTIRVIDGPDRGVTKVFGGTRPMRIYIGQSASCDVVLADSHVSRRHAAIDLVDRPRIVDLGSTNGTVLDGVHVVEAFLRGGDTLKVGSSTLVLELNANQGETPISPATAFGRVLGQSTEMRRLFPLCERLALSDVSVVVEGETGTGKELLAESIHETGTRCAGPFVVFDCAAVAPTLVESALFGHERGAFTGAVDTRKGVFEQADGGTLLIDEIGDLPLSLQPRLLRALQNGQVQRVGANRWISVNVRVIAATRRDLDHEIQAGRFRDDLYFRLAVARVELPPLRRRKGDVPVLAEAFWNKLGGVGPLPPSFLDRYENYAWPGNVRELYNAVSRRVALGEAGPDDDGYLVASPSLPPRTTIDLESMGLVELPLARAREKVVGEFERFYVDRVLARYEGHVARAAEAAGIARRYFQLLRARHQR
jgi:two-component system, NtrC family, response regulator HydG